MFPELATNPYPSSKAINILHDSILSWEPGAFAQTHDVYFGTDYDKVYDATATDSLYMGRREAASYNPGQLDFGKTYYWRVDEVTDAPDYSVFSGDVWSFTVEPLGVPIENITVTASGTVSGMEPENTINGSGLNGLDQHSVQSMDMWMAAGANIWIQYEFDNIYKLHEIWVWNSSQIIESFLGFGVKEVAIEYSTDGETWLALDRVVELAQASGLPTYKANTVVALGGIMAMGIKLSVVSAHGFTVQSGLAEVRFLAIPVTAQGPQPEDGGISTGTDVQLSWRSGREAVTHDIAFSENLDAVVSGTAPVSTVTEDSYDAGVLNYNTTYYWQVTEVNEAAIPTAHVSDIWSFTTPDYDSLDDFESYSSKEGQEVFMSWVDGYSGDTSLGGSRTGHLDSPFVETSIVKNGNKSMPIFYDNNGNFTDIDGNASSPRFSAVMQGFESTRDFAKGDGEVLAVSFHGSPATGGIRGTNSGPDPLYLVVEDSTGKTVTVTHPDAAAVQINSWQDWLVPMSRFNSLELSSIKSVTIGVGYPDGSQVGSEGILYIDDLRIGVPVPVTE